MWIYRIRRIVDKIKRVRDYEDKTYAYEIDKELKKIEMELAKHIDDTMAKHLERKFGEPERRKHRKKNEAP